MSGKGKIHEHPNVNTNGFDKNPQNINRKGAPLSFKRRYRELHENNEGTIWVPENETKRRTREVVKGDKVIKVKEVGLVLSKEDEIIHKLDRLISQSSDSISFNAIKFIWEVFDGKPKQEIEQKTTHDFEGDPFAKIRENAGAKAAPEKPKE